MSVVRPKKNLGQHFLRDQNIARKIVDSLGTTIPNVLEIGPGTGILTRFLLQQSKLNVYAVEVDSESVDYLNQQFPSLKERLFTEDFLKWELKNLPESFSIIGNFPYNISSQIFFRILELRNRVPEVVGMVQKEVAERLSAPPGNKTYGILSVLLAAWYDTEYLFTVPQQVFVPPPKVKSAVIRLRRNSIKSLPCNEALFAGIVKSAFNQRRKMLRNSLGDRSKNIPGEVATQRPEQLTVDDVIEVTQKIENHENL